MNFYTLIYRRLNILLLSYLKGYDPELMTCFSKKKKNICLVIYIVYIQDFRDNIIKDNLSSIPNLTAKTSQGKENKQQKYIERFMQYKFSRQQESSEMRTQRTEASGVYGLS